MNLSLKSIHVSIEVFSWAPRERMVTGVVSSNSAPLCCLSSEESTTNQPRLTPGVGIMPLSSTVDMNMVLGEAMRGRQLPQVEPQAASMGWPQLGQGCSSVRAGGAVETRTSSGEDVSSTLRQADLPTGLCRGAGPRLLWDGIPFMGLSNTGGSPLGMIGLRATMVKHLTQRIRAPEVSSVRS